jgi:Lrp/AsnC family transcriptional regulator for asnA, asnC and gidA
VNWFVREVKISKNEISATDKAIIRMLQEDGRRSYAEIATELNLSPSAIQQRAQKLMENELIKVRAVTNPVLVGVPVVASINLKVDGSIIRKIANELTRFDEIGYVVISAGSHDIQIEVACRDNTHLLDMITEISKIEGVRSTETSIYLEIVKNTYQWGIP